MSFSRMYGFALLGEKRKGGDAILGHGDLPCTWTRWDAGTDQKWQLIEYALWGTVIQ